MQQTNTRSHPMLYSNYRKQETKEQVVMEKIMVIEDDRKILIVSMTRIRAEFRKADS